MDYHVERIISQVEIAQRGKDTAVQDATTHAWLMAVHGAQPKRYLVLRSVDEREGPYNGATRLLALRFTFAVDEV